VYCRFSSNFDAQPTSILKQLRCSTNCRYATLLIVMMDALAIAVISILSFADRLNHQSHLNAVPSPPSIATDCRRLLGSRPGFNTVVQGDIWQVGRLPQQHYVVIVPVSRSAPANALLTTIKTCTPDAFLIESHRGPYIQVGAFYRRAEAEDLSKVLECQHIDARVVYFP
jgi:hypothetical protein